MLINDVYFSTMLYQIWSGAEWNRGRVQYKSEDSALIALAKVYEDYNRDARR